MLVLWRFIMATVSRPYYLKYIEWNPTGEHKMVGWSCVRKLEDGNESDWHNVGLHLKPQAQKRLTQLNNAFERRYNQQKGN